MCDKEEYSVLHCITTSFIKFSNEHGHELPPFCCFFQCKIWRSDDPLCLGDNLLSVPTLFLSAVISPFVSILFWAGRQTDKNAIHDPPFPECNTINWNTAIRPPDFMISKLPEIVRLFLSRQKRFNMDLQFKPNTTAQKLILDISARICCNSDAAYNG